jgi:NAD(P)-dependent dehydrogenase (short-subunit alcohol dehydrogenase family)
VLRLEVAPFGIRVSLIEPGAVRTKFLANSARHSPADNGAGPYAGFKANAPRPARPRPRRALIDGRAWLTQPPPAS